MNRRYAATAAAEPIAASVIVAKDVRFAGAAVNGPTSSRQGQHLPALRTTASAEDEAPLLPAECPPTTSSAVRYVTTVTIPATDVVVATGPTGPAPLGPDDTPRQRRKFSLMPPLTAEDLKNTALGQRDPVTVAQLFGEEFASKFCSPQLRTIPLGAQQPKTPVSPLPYDTEEKMIRVLPRDVADERLPFEIRDDNLPR